MDHMRTAFDVRGTVEGLRLRYPSSGESRMLYVYHYDKVIYQESHPMGYTVRLAEAVCKASPHAFSTLTTNNHHFNEGILDFGDDWCSIEGSSNGIVRLAVITYSTDVDEKAHYARVDAIRARLKADGFLLTGNEQCEIEMTIRKVC